jgi:hypothetical protein
VNVMVQMEHLDLVAQLIARDAEQTSGDRDVAVGVVQGFDDQLALQLLDDAEMDDVAGGEVDGFDSGCEMFMGGAVFAIGHENLLWLMSRSSTRKRRDSTSRPDKCQQQTQRRF